MEQPWKATAVAGQQQHLDCQNRSPLSLSLALSVFCLNSSRDKISIKSLRIFFKIGWTDAVSGREERRREGEKERERERRGGRLSSRKEDYHRRKNDGGIQPYDSPRPRPSGFLLFLSLSLTLPVLLCAAACATTQNNLLLDSALEFQRLQGCISVLNEHRRRISSTSPPMQCALSLSIDCRAYLGVEHHASSSARKGFSP